MNYKDVLKFYREISLYRERVIVLDDNEYGIELVAFRQFPTDWFSVRNCAMDLDICGYRDWKIPTIKELESIVNQCSFEEISSMFKKKPSAKGFCGYCQDGELNLLWSSDVYKEDDDCWGCKVIHVYNYERKKREITLSKYNLNVCYIRYADN